MRNTKDFFFKSNTQKKYCKMLGTMGKEVSILKGFPFRGPDLIVTSNKYASW